MKIALDWDNTFTKDTDLWQSFVLQSNARDHKVWIVTSRGKDTPIEFIPEGVQTVIYCEYRAKEKVTNERGIKIDVWIDDDPRYIVEGFVE